MASQGILGAMDQRVSWVNKEGPAPGSSMNTPYENYNPGFDNRPITMPLQIAALYDDSQKRYSEGDLLFAVRGSLTSEYIHVVNLQTLNTYLEKRRLLDITPKNELEESPQQKKMRTIQERYIDMPSTVEEFVRMITFLGVFETSMDKFGVRTRKISFSSKGRVTIPNIFRPHSGRHIAIGDTAHLVVKKKYNTASSFMNYKGEKEGKPTPGSFLQVEAYWEPGSRNPIHTTHHKFNQMSEDSMGSDTFTTREQRSYDVDTIEEDNNYTAIEQRVYRTDEEGLTLFDSDPEHRAPIMVKKYEQGYVIKLGVVRLVDKLPMEDDIQLAHRSIDGYHRLFGYSTIVIDLTPTTFSQVIF
jgi:hypothetical protein